MGHRREVRAEMTCHRCKEPLADGDYRWFCDPCNLARLDEERRARLTDAQRAYEDTFGREAQERQTALAKDHFACCGEHKESGHHEACPKRPVDVAPAVHAGQETLA